MSVIAKFKSQIDYCPYCGSHDFSAQPGFLAHAGASFINEAVDAYCESHTGVSPSDFDITLANPEDFAKNYICHSCGEKFTNAECVDVFYEGDDYSPGDDIEYLVENVFEAVTGYDAYSIDRDEELSNFLIYQSLSNFESNLMFVFGTKNLKNPFGSADADEVTFNEIVKFYEDIRDELDEYANLPMIDKLGLRKQLEEGKEMLNQIRGSKLVNDTISSVNDAVKHLGIDEDLKTIKKGLFSLFE